MADYLLFVDETKPDKHYSNFCFAGIVVEREYYEKELTKLVNQLKQKHFGRTDIVFHYTDMRKNKKDFACLQDEKIRKPFWDDYAKLLSEAKLDILCIYFDNNKMSKLRYGKAGNNYNIGFYHLLDMFTYYLRDKGGYGQICVESRCFNENKNVLDVFYRYLQNGSIYFDEKEVSNYLSSIGFTVKGDNCIGLQIADIVPSQMLRYNANVKKDFHKLAKILGAKIYNVDTEYKEILGIKNIL